MFFSFKQTKIIVLITCIVATILVVIFPYMKKPKQALEKISYCNGYAIQMKKINPEINQDEVYNKCIEDYVKP